MNSTNQKRTKRQSTPKVIEPIQKRSRDTYDRILTATENLLESKRFVDLTMTEIAKRAKCGVGTMYGRFANKEALLECLEERLVINIEKQRNAFKSSRDWTDVGFVERVELLVDQIIKSYKTHRAILREILGRIHSGNDGASEVSRNTMTSVFEANVTFLIGGLKTKEMKKAEKVVSLALISVITVLQNRIIHGTTSPIQIEFPVSFFKTHLPEMVIAFVRQSGFDC